ncbi:MAG: hypothetical protein KZQ95_04700 [Candidatus Thiodiazotropha sp. (ex Epidulcina cf. delphinae)]|nr:hypothetical protein [Candidatus Thiodiazotropha sp. (ex Epidulcina cf. delphinae)]
MIIQSDPLRNILLADEPASALDPAHQLDVMTLHSEHCEAGQSVIVVLHDLSLAAHYCHRPQLLHQGGTGGIWVINALQRRRGTPQEH